MKKRILFAGVGSYVSGLEIVTLHLIRKMKEEGHEVKCVVNGWNDGMFIKELQKIGIPFEEIKLGWYYLKQPLWTLDSLAHWPSAYRKYRRILREFNPDICHFCNYASVITLYPLLKKRASVYNLQEPHEPTRKNLFLYRLLNKRIKTFTAVSEYIRRVLIDLGIPDGKIRVVYNGVPLIAGIGSGQGGSRLTFGIIGQVASWKGHETLIAAAALLKGSPGIPFAIKIFGNDQTPYSELLKKKMSDTGTESYFSWEGFVKDQDSIYNQVDVVIVPSLSQEPCSLTIIESMMRAKPLIVSDRGGNPELVDDGKNGFIFKADDAVRLAERMRLFLGKDPATLDIGLKAHEKALARFTDTKMAATYDEIYS